MSAATTNPPDADRWKEKYRLLLSEWEAREAQWREIESILRRGVHRLALIASGADPTVDAHLVELRSTLKGDGDLTDVVKALDTVAGIAGRIGMTQRERTAAPPAGRGPEHAGAADRRPAREREVMEDLAAQVHGALARRGYDLHPQTDPHAAFETALMAVFDGLPIPEEMSSAAQQIRRKLKAGITPAEYPGFLDTVAEFSAAAQAAMQGFVDDIQSFLVSVTERLQEIDACLNQRMESADRSAQHIAAMSESVRTELRGLAHSANTIADMDTLKHAVQSRLQRIESMITDHLSREKQLANRSGHEIKRLLARLDELENETRTLRLQVSQAQASASFDSLTGLYNRAHFDSRLAHDLVRCAQKGTGVALVLLDIDDFRRLNGTFGHHAGDRVLEALGKLIAEHSNLADCAARLGADHFALLMQESDAAQGNQVAERIRQTFERARFYHRGTEVPVTLSGAVTAFRSGDDPQTMVARAEHALREARTSGGNQVRVAHAVHGG